MNKHNLRNYDNDREMIEIVYGTDNLYKDVQNLYLQEFEQASCQIKNIYKRVFDNPVISNENIEIIKNYTKDVKDTTKAIRNVNDLNILIEDFESSYINIVKENNSLKYQLELKNDEIDNLKSKLSTKDKVISKLQTEKEKLKQELQKFKDFWHSIMGHFHKRICYDKDENYKIVSDNLYRSGIFTDDENEIANDIARKVKTKEDIEQVKNKKKDNFELK